MSTLDFKISTEARLVCYLADATKFSEAVDMYFHLQDLMEEKGETAELIGKLASGVTDWPVDMVEAMIQARAQYEAHHEEINRLAKGGAS
ncbi:MAG: hypothetical protein IPN53_05245 [Comamonadaceae bacterium]|nr:hypothetical protein [Comamonadaceae bacterium]